MELIAINADLQKVSFERVCLKTLTEKSYRKDKVPMGNKNGIIRAFLIEQHSLNLTNEPKSLKIDLYIYNITSVTLKSWQLDALGYG